MPKFDWIGKKAVVNHHLEVPFHLLKREPVLSISNPESDNLIVQGDNLIALKALLPYYAGQVKCIYIDPPYNTGDENWIYNDSVNSPEIREWLGKTVGREAEDLSRHDKWLCMMFPRLKLLTKFLCKDGFLFISIDEIEIARLRLVMEEILPENIHYICTLIWKSRRNLDNRSLHNVSVDHEFVLAYRMGKARFRGTEKDLSKYSNADNDPRGPWMSDNLVGLATKDRRPNLHYDLVNPATGVNYGCPPKGWRYAPDTMRKKIEEGRILWPKKKSGRPRHKKFQYELQDTFAGYSSFIKCGNTNEGTEEVMQIMGEEKFIFPKPRSLIQALIQQSTTNNDIIMDSFAGTGTTGHAVLALNKQEKTNRSFILVEMEDKICKDITRERIKRVIEGYSYKNSNDEVKYVKPLGGGFDYCRLGDPLFDKNGKIRDEVQFQDLASFVFFIETGRPLPKKSSGKSPLLGIQNETAIYLLYNGILKDKKANGGNALTRSILATLPPHDGPKIVYGTSCRLGETRLKKENIIFRQIPYDLRLE